MLTIGLIGGMSWESSARYYELINELTRKRLGGLHSAPSVLISVDFAEIEALQASGDWDRAADLLAARAREAEAAGADLLLLCTNTMHRLAGVVADATAIPLLHLADATADAVIDAGSTRVGLLGTAYTMEQAFYRERLERRGLTLHTPRAEDRAEVHAVIYDELCRGVIRESSRQAVVGVIERLASAGAEGVILGCTELELLIDASDSPLPIFPTTRIHAAAAVEAALARGEANL